jgi:hypothetical protein
MGIRDPTRSHPSLRSEMHSEQQAPGRPAATQIRSARTIEAHGFKMVWKFD